MRIGRRDEERRARFTSRILREADASDDRRVREVQANGTAVRTNDRSAATRERRTTAEGNLDLGAAGDTRRFDSFKVVEAKKRHDELFIQELNSLRSDLKCVRWTSAGILLLHAITCALCV